MDSIRTEQYENTNQTMIVEMENGKVIPVCELSDLEIKAIRVALYHQWRNTTDDDGHAITCSQEIADATYKALQSFEKLENGHGTLVSFSRIGEIT